MNSILSWSRLTTLTPCGTSPGLLTTIRWASKKTGTGCRNSKQAPGKRRGVKVNEGEHVFEHDIIVTQNKLNCLPGLNVKCVGSLQLRACKEGKVTFTKERADLQTMKDHAWIKKFCPNPEGVPYFKLYAHVIPPPEHKRFRLVRQV